MLRLVATPPLRIRAVAVALAVALVPGALSAASLPDPFAAPRSSRFT